MGAWVTERTTEEYPEFWNNVAIRCLKDFPDNIPQLEWVRARGVNFHAIPVRTAMIDVYSHRMHTYHPRALIWFIENGADGVGFQFSESLRQMCIGQWTKYAPVACTSREPTCLIKSM